MHKFFYIHFLVYFYSIISSFAVLDDFDHVALLECNPIKLRFQVVALGKGNAQEVTKSMEKVQNIYLFDETTARFPNQYRLCLVCLVSDENKNFRRKITWIDKEKAIEPQLANVGINKKVIQQLLNQYEKVNEFHDMKTDK